MGAYENYLAHHGIKGQKWGIRRYQNEDGTLTPEGQKRYDRYNEVIAGLNTVNSGLKRQYMAKNHKNGPYGRKILRSISVNERDIKTLEERRDKLLINKKKIASEYSKEYDKATALDDEADVMFKKVYKQYKALGSNFIARMISVSKAQKGNGTKEANEYLKAFDEANKKGDLAYEHWQKAEELYKKLGKTKIGRVIAAAKYT